MEFNVELFLSLFVTLAVVIDAPGVVPVFATLTEGGPKGWRTRMAVKAMIVATFILFFFAFLGEALLSAMGITLDAFRAAGGVLLFLIAVDMLFEKRTERREERAQQVLDEEHEHPTPRIDGLPDDVSVFPLAIPLLSGPGSIAAVMLAMSQGGNEMGSILAVSAAILANIVIALVLFLSVGGFMKILGSSGAAMLTRILGVILAALSAQFIFDGIRGAFALGGAGGH